MRIVTAPKEGRCVFCLRKRALFIFSCFDCINIDEKRIKDGYRGTSPTLVEYSSKKEDFPMVLTHITKKIIFRWKDDFLFTNVPQIIVAHSLNGYSAGYAGSGPAELALNLCQLALNYLEIQGPSVPVPFRPELSVKCSYLAWEMHQDFKARFIQPMEQGLKLDLDWDYFVTNIFTPVMNEYMGAADEMSQQIFNRPYTDVSPNKYIG